ncbi:protein-lysine methyltransferase METTL21C-like [Dunckerocampus dactyliophorus]|uniref:protein-lysine methyltransferase METTL21C-like n=1 Tax=Dunckerocampus dactyliophorus TaxID=161453 RepID=UPI0024066386|nr:protein-lysine methyltransferase METTL21C-like [Dunckerocampus dactyliophorus]
MEEDEEQKGKKEKDGSHKEHRQGWTPCFFQRPDKELYHYVGQEIIIQEAFDSYAGMIWPAALALCQYLDSHRNQLSLVDKAVLEIGAGTGLLSIVASLLGAWVTATDLPEVLSNLRFNLCKNTRGRCRHTPQVAPLSWGYDLESTYPTSVYRYDYILAADVVYHHDFLEELMATMKHFCKPGTTLLWANKVRMESDLTFADKFKKAFKTRVLHEDGEIKIFMATCREDGTRNELGEGGCFHGNKDGEPANQ